ncbi:Sec-independent protein translocase protein TatB [Faunimonas sp. B44]|uniref:Sec-independent protein translocase protein TatB n=1 Tax=Faunimonas sp. B44 TaxID=3461493 RepID=UPI0040447D61
MLDIGWSELLVIAAIAVVVVGPKDLPRMLRAFGKSMGQVRRTANDFRRQFDDALREAEREADLADARKSIESITRSNPLADVKKELTSAAALGQEKLRDVNDSAQTMLREEPPVKTGAIAADTAEAVGAETSPAAVSPPAPAAEPAAPAPAAPAPAEASERARGSDAA